MNDIEEIKKSCRRKYIEDMSDIIKDLFALHDVVGTFLDVSIRQGKDEEIISCLNIIDQSVCGIVTAANRKIGNYE